MTRAVFGGVVMAALAIALAFRLIGADLRPVHHDEANQAVRFGMLLETGEYRYDRNDHHGPTLYYLTLPVAWIRGQTTLARLDERTIRAVPAIFGAGLILLFPLLAGGLGRTSVAVSAFLAALSPALTYYSRSYIQESIFVFFTLAFLIALGRYALQARAVWAICAGTCAGLAYATKETSLIVLLTAAAAAAVARVWTGAADEREGGTPAVSSWTRAGHAMAGLAAALLVSLVFYSSFFTHPEGLVESIRAFSIYVERGVGSGPHAQPWDYYLRLLAYTASGGVVWSEGLILALALVGLLAAARGSTARFWPRYIGLYAVLTCLAFSSVRYKTPWNLLPFYAGFVLLAGYGAAALVDGATSRVLRGFVVVLLLLACGQLGMQNWRANFQYPADPRNPYVYAQTTPDFLRLVRRVTDVSALHPDGAGMLVKVIAGPYEQWPLPWYLRRMTQVGYWIHAAEAGPLADAPVIVASQDQAETVGSALGERYVQEFYGLRPDVMLTVYVKRALWDRFIASRAPR